MKKYLVVYCLLLSMILSSFGTVYYKVEAVSNPIVINQNSVPNIDIYPNQPTGYSYFDYNQRAIDYDNFIYDWSQPGDYPTIRWDTTHANMSSDTIANPSYYGDIRANTDGNQESIVAMGNIISGTLVGGNKESYPADVAKVKTVVTSTSDTTNISSYAVDNDKNTYWQATGTGNQWIYVDLGSSKSINKVILDWASSRYATNYTIQTSSDASNWSTIYTKSGGTGGKETITFTSTNARYVKMNATAAGQNAYGIKGFGVYSNIDYLALLRTFFKANSSEKIPYDKASGGGTSWWYDTLPSDLFYMIGDLYPNNSLVTEKLQGIADDLYDMTVTLGAENLSFEHQSFDHATNQAYDNLWKESDAGLGVGVVLYWAYKKFGDSKYLDAAKWIMDYYEKLNKNPYYELLTIFSPYLAARMNAELGTNYDVSRYFGWLFGVSDARPGWGTLNGTWNGIGVDGLTGSQEDRGGYGFPMNTYLTGLFAPVVKYDHSFARIVGKFLLNASNSLRVTYPDQISSTKQFHGSRFINAPEKAMPYEGFIRWANDPNVTLPEGSAYGDPVLWKDSWGTGDSCTDLSVYSAAYVGFYGAILKDTNVSQILQIDCNKLDFYKDTSYPTYLYYNPYSVSKSVQITLSSSSDLFNAVSGDYLAQNVSGTQSFNIPADTAMVVVIAPANGTLTYSGNKTLINNVPVAYNSYAAAGNNIAFGRTVSSSGSEHSNKIASNIINGKENDMWSSLFGSSEYAYVDLGASKTFNEVALKWDSQSNNKPYKVQVSDDSTNWTDVVNGSAGLNDYVTFPSVNKRYVKLLGTQAASQYLIEDFSDVSDWTVQSNASKSTSGGIATFTNTTAPYGVLSKSNVTYNLDIYPTLKVVVPEVGSNSQWCLQVSDGTNTYYVQAQNGNSGTYYYDIKSKTGWSGSKTMTFYLFTMGGSGKYFKIDEMSAYSTDIYKLKELEVYNSSSTFSDDFNDGNDNGWTRGAGTWTVESSQYKGTGDGGQCYSLAGNNNWTNYSLETKVKLNGGSNDAGIVVRALDTNNMYLFKIASTSMEIYKVMGGSYFSLASVSTTIPTGNYYTYRVVAVNNTISAYKDGVLQMRVTDDTFSGGKIGVRSAGTSVTYFDDVSVSDVLMKAPVDVVTKENFEKVSEWGNGSQASITSQNGIGTITNDSGTWGYISKDVNYNVDDMPYLGIEVTDVGAGSSWALKVDDGTNNYYLQGNTSNTGTFYYNLKNITGWSGNKAFKIQLLPIGGLGKYFKVNEIFAKYAKTLEDFNTISDWGWASACSMSASSGISTITNTSGTWGYVQKYFTYDLTAFPNMQVKVPEVGAGASWALKVDDGTSSYYIQGNTSSTGVFNYDIKAITGWSGVKTFAVQLLPIGGTDKYFKLDQIDIKK